MKTPSLSPTTVNEGQKEMGVRKTGECHYTTIPPLMAYILARKGSK